MQPPAGVPQSCISQGFPLSYHRRVVGTIYHLGGCITVIIIEQAFADVNAHVYSYCAFVWYTLSDCVPVAFCAPLWRVFCTFPVDLPDHSRADSRGISVRLVK